MSVDKQQEQQMRISDAEISLLKATFAENDVLLKSVRKVFLGLPMKEGEAEYLSGLFKGSVELQKLARRMFLPEVEGDTPLGQNIDLWMTLQITDKTPEMAHLFLKSRELLIDLIEDGLEALLDPKTDDEVIDYHLSNDAEADYIGLMARNTFIQHIDQVLLQIKFLAGLKSETVEETKERLSKNSNK